MKEKFEYLVFRWSTKSPFRNPANALFCSDKDLPNAEFHTGFLGEHHGVDCDRAEVVRLGNGQIKTLHRYVRHAVTKKWRMVELDYENF